MSEDLDGTRSLYRPCGHSELHHGSDVIAVCTLRIIEGPAEALWAVIVNQI